MHRMLCYVIACCLLSVACSALASREACILAAEKEILRAPDKEELVVTTSRQFKRDLAKFFCTPQWQGEVVLEVGVYHGYSTAVLASIFKQVISVDAEPEYLAASAEWNKARDNVIYFQFHTGQLEWVALKANPIKVVVIDGDHTYKQVYLDALHAIESLETAEIFIFDDFAYEEGVRRTVEELQAEGLLRACVGLGGGGKSGRFKHPDFVDPLNGTEGRLCRRGKHGEAASRHAGRLAKALQMQAPYFLYDYPVDRLLRSIGLIQFHSGRAVWTAAEGQLYQLGLQVVGRPGDDGSHVFNMRIETPGPRPTLGQAPPTNVLFDRAIYDVIFNAKRSAFFISYPDTGVARWWGLRMDKLMDPFSIANADFNLSASG